MTLTNAGQGPFTTHVYDTNRNLPMLLYDGNRKYVYGVRLAFAVNGNSTLEVYHTDGLGSVRAVTYANGSVTQSYGTDAYGAGYGATYENDDNYENGYDLIRAVRALSPEQGGETPANALTGYVRVEDRMKALAASYQMFVPKPVEANDFIGESVDIILDAEECVIIIQLPVG